MNLNDIMKELEKQGVNVEGISKEHKQQIENYLEDKNDNKDKPTK